MDKDVIIILGAMAISLISAIASRRNKKKQQSTATSTLEDQPKETKGLFGNLQKAFEESAKMAQEQAKKIEQYEQMDGRGRKEMSSEESPASPFDFSPSYEAAIEPEVVMDESTAKRIETAKLRVSKIRSVNTVIETESEEVISDIMEGFDLRKAVVYSEILKPKF